MRGDNQEGGDLFSYVSLEQRIPKNHPIRKMRNLVDEALILRNASSGLPCCKSSTRFEASGN